MTVRMPTNCGDETCPACVIAGDFIFLAHHAGGFESSEVVHQLEVCFERMSKTLEIRRSLIGRPGTDQSLPEKYR